MARAAVKAKQRQTRASVQPAKAARGRKRHASGGNPNEDLFFSRLRRRQKWVFLALAIVFCISFVAIGVGSGNGSGLQEMFSGLLGGNSDAVSKAQAEIKKNPAKGWKDLANAYVSKNDTANAIRAFTTYLNFRKTDAATWAELGGLQEQQGSTFAQQYQAAKAAAAASNPGSMFQPTGSFGTALGTNAIDQYYSQAGSGQMQQLYQQAIGAYSSALQDYKTAAGLQPRNANNQYLLASAAQNIGQYPVAVHAYKQYLKLNPTSPLKSQILATIKQLEQAAGATTPAPTGKKKK